MRKLYLTVVLFTALSSTFVSAKKEECQSLWATCTESEWAECKECFGAVWESWFGSDWPTWRCAKRLYREANCNYSQECAEACYGGIPLSSTCETTEVCDEATLRHVSMLYFFMTVMGAYDWVRSEKDVCKYTKKCYQYGYCPGSNCEHSLTNEQIRAAIDRYIEAYVKYEKGL